MKVAVIGDMHLGVKAGNQDFLDFQFYWLEECLKKLQKMGIDTIIQTGDFFDVRQYMKLNVMHSVLVKFPTLLNKYKIIGWYTYAGNHDLFYRDSNGICSLELLKALNNPDGHDTDTKFYIYADKVGYINFKGKSFAFVPWLNKNNEKEFLAEINSNALDYVFGHFEMVGMPMIPGGAVCERGLQTKDFSKYKRVISGHFHTVSEHLNCTMVGTPYHLNWGDTADGDNRGFWVLDTDTDEFVLHKNEEHMTLFSVIEYDHEIKYDETYFAPYEGNLVKVIVKEKPDNKHYKKFTDLLSKAKLIDYKIIDTTIIEIEKVEISEEVLSLDTLSTMNAFIDGQSDEFNKPEVKTLAKDIYLEVLNANK